jgi:hypothetical protein
MAESDDKTAGPDRDGRGRFAPGNDAGRSTRWGADNPPPKSPGRPRTDAWVSELKDQLEERPDLRKAIANRLLKIALKGSDQAALKAISVIEDRIGGTVTTRIHAEVGGDHGVLVVPGPMSPNEWIAEAMKANAEAREPGGEDDTR